MAMDGLQILGRELYGVFPLRGKFLNVRNATREQLENNAEFCALKKILGLVEGADYSESIESLRYVKKNIRF
jgi:DNA topoisomerase-2